MNDATVGLDLEVREVPWEISPDRTVRGFAFNGQVPGPVIEANAGDELLVRLTNRLDERTTVHWHGIRVPARMDGTESVQQAVAPGQTFEYRFVVPDAGTYWYHSHVNETEQVERGL
jgi:FtsP/CotA-like multicopper oxidase with cupredoxin domain